MAPTASKLLRGRLATTMGIVGKSGCTTTAYALSPKGCLVTDPGYYIPLGCLELWFSILNQEEHLHVGVEKTWRKTYARLQKKGRWNKVYSLMSSVMAYLLDFRWEVSHPWKWTSPFGQVYYIKPGLADDQSAVVQAFTQCITQKYWGQASEYYCGGGRS